MDPNRDLILAILGGSVSLAGLLLVFAGFLFSQAASLPPETDDKIIDGFRWAGKIAAGPFVLCLVVAGFTLRYLLVPTALTLWLSWAGFGLLLAVTAVYGCAVIFRYL